MDRNIDVQAEPFEPPVSLTWPCLHTLTPAYRGADYLTGTQFLSRAHAWLLTSEQCHGTRILLHAICETPTFEIPRTLHETTRPYNDARRTVVCGPGGTGGPISLVFPLRLRRSFSRILLEPQDVEHDVLDPSSLNAPDTWLRLREEGDYGLATTPDLYARLDNI